MEQLSTAERVDGFARFFAKANEDGPLVGFFRDTYYPLKRFRTEKYIRSGTLDPRSIEVDAFMPEYERLHELHEQTAGDFIWAGASFWGVPWMEALSGCGVAADQETGSTRSVSPSHFSGARDIPDFDRSNPWVELCGRFLKALAAQSDGRYPLGTTLMRGVSDLLSAVYGSPEFLFAAYDQPADTDRAVEKLNNLWIEFAEYQLELIPPFHGGTGSYFYGCWLPGRGVWMQDDATALMSPALFERFGAPAIDAVTSAFDTVVMHLHPSTCIPADFLASSPLSAVEMHIDIGGPPAEDLLPFYRTVLERKPLVIWGDLTDADLSCIKANLDLRSVAIMPVVESASRAEEIWAFLKG